MTEKRTTITVNGDFEITFKLTLGNIIKWHLLGKPKQSEIKKIIETTIDQTMEVARDVYNQALNKAQTIQKTMPKTLH
ncbi:hypothetical protein KAR91_87735 [Candidatus Pacearchaeota archaeon]|nr:hypothetical protein [Candidatus Pacearchaeota archaeon]